MTDRRTVEMVLPVPPSVNRYWRQGRAGIVYLSAEAQAYKDAVRLTNIVNHPFAGPVALNLTVFRPRKKGDLDNYLKALLDALKGIIYYDDDQVVEISAYRDDDPKNPRVHLLAWEATV